MTDLIIANKSDLVSVADAIRTKTGGTEKLSFPTGFIDAVASISGGDSGGVSMTTYRANEIKCAQTQQLDDPNLTGDAAWGNCQVQGSNSYIYRVFLQYDLSGIPDDATILSAKMHVYCSYHNDNAAQGTTNIARVTSEWEEETCCWNLMPTWTGIYQTGDNFAPPAVGEWGIWDITALVKEWVGVDKQYPNYGLHVVNNNEGSYRYNWCFKNHYDSQNRGTYIEIEYVTGIESSSISS